MRGARPSTVPLQLRILEDILGCRAYWSQHLLAATLMLLFQICYSQPEHRHLPLAQGKVGEEPGPKRTGLNLDEGRVWGPKTEPRIWHPKSVPPLLPASVSVPLKGPKNGAAKPPTCPALARKVSKANRSASCSLPLHSRHRHRHGQPIYWRTFRPILAEALSRSNWWMPAAAFVLSQRSL